MTLARSAKDTVSELLEWRAAQTPEATAFCSEQADGLWQPISWRDFADRVTRLRHGLHAAGLRGGDRIALIAPVSLQWELLHHAALSMGAVVVGLDAHDLPARVAAMAEQAEIVAFAVFDAKPLAALRPGQLQRTRFVVGLGDPLDPSGGLHSMSLLQLEALGVSGEAVEPAPPAADATATIIFTSGTTGEPKGIAYTHQQVVLAIDAIADAYSFVDHKSRLLCWLPLSNLFQRIVNLAGMRQGAATYLLGDPRRVMDVVARVSPDIFIGVPRFYEKLHEGLRRQIAGFAPWKRQLVEWAWGVGRRSSAHRLRRKTMPYRLAIVWWVADRLVLRRLRSVMGTRLRGMVTGSAPTPLWLLWEFHALGWLVLEAYGMSENVLPIAMNLRNDYRFGTVGRPLSGNDVQISDDGIILVNGPALFSGYLGAAVRNDSWFATGDLGQIDVDGYLQITGRASEAFKTSTGRRVSPAAIESRLRAVSGIEQVVVVGAGRQHLVALCEATDTSGESMDAMADRLRQAVLQLDRRNRPAAIAFVDCPFSVESGELTSNLKLRRQNIELQRAQLIEQLYTVTAPMNSQPATSVRKDVPRIIDARRPSGER